ncbi:hypothetical protein B9G69_001895 [Bdellovibrio sp. SKB1291214]|uniref:hypothetical protein n=1 Tax=Bdellovibrio sp. SKB1291214 TaxID=1732569 RepID=UPI00113280FF|nr:hypothetical protein [Bdellovibrio sp. SKB1291214]UYL09323.1 hypothetical protein B9G69_001895 [Bdellovibrio sp. SKB1291214]
MKLLFLSILIVCSFRSAWGNAPSNSTNKQTSTIIPSSYLRKPVLAFRYEEVAQPDGYENNGTYSFLFADYFAQV